MKKGKSISVFRRLGLGLVQHIVAAIVMVLIASVLFNSFLTVTTMNGSKIYSLDPLNQKSSFEDSEVFRDLFQTAVNDVIRLGIIREQMETNHKFDASKVIDVTAFMNRYGTAGRNYGEATAKFKMEDLIIWVRYGLEYKNRTMSLSEFVDYYQEACIPENFTVDDYGNLTFSGYHEPEVQDEQYAQKYEAILNKMAEYSEMQLEDMAFSYVMSKTSEGIALNKEDDGNLTVYINSLVFRYATTDHQTQLYDLVESWPEFIQLQKNIVDASNTLAENYELYQNCAKLYAEGKSNLKYVIRMRNANGEKDIFSNIPDLAELDDEKLTEVFEENSKYLIYYPNSLEIMGNEDFTEGNVYELLRAAHYPFLEDVYIWISLDTSYEVKDDAFCIASEMYERIVPNTAGILTILIALLIVWVGIFLYLTVTAGSVYAEDGSIKHYLNAFDKIWTEVFLCAIAGFGYGIYRIILYLRQMTMTVYETRMSLGNSAKNVLLTQYGLYAAVGFWFSVFLCLLWYSLVRRLKSLNVYKNSLLRLAINATYGAFETVMAHQSSLISVLLPYMIFLMLNFVSVIGIILFQDPLKRAVLLVFILIVDVSVGIRLFKKNAEFNDIIDGINRIRSGEVEYKLDTGKLHGMNKFLSDAVNNIGEGIDNAVKTSVKDERLKTDLITNVSHDLKTPLTSIINYVDLLKRTNIQDPQAKNYVEILENKSQRLKDLTDDLVEASKISSGNITLNLEVLDLGELLQQTIGELSEKLEAAKLSVVAEIDEKPSLIYADSRRMWRVMENLFNNICKYAMEGTRVYAEVKVTDNARVLLQIKNVSKAQMNIHADELTERFIRGDSSRSTEGSGLGLYIAKSLTNVLGGNFEIQLDADLFKVNIDFPLYQQEKKE